MEKLNKMIEKIEFLGKHDAMSPGSSKEIARELKYIRDNCIVIDKKKLEGWNISVNFIDDNFVLYNDEDNKIIKNNSSIIDILERF